MSFPMISGMLVEAGIRAYIKRQRAATVRDLAEVFYRNTSNDKASKAYDDALTKMNEKDL